MNISFNKNLLPLFFAIFLILAGGLCTYFTARSVHVHLREGKSNNVSNTFFNEDLSDSNSTAASTLPFSIRLEKFEIEYHEGTRAPKDYISYITIIETVSIDKFRMTGDYSDRSANDNANGHPTEINDESIVKTTARISMNKIGRYHGYRIFQEDYDGDLKGSVLLVRHDPWGIALVYSGFALLLLSMIWLLLRRDGEFRRLLRALSLVALLFSTTQAAAIPIQVEGGRWKVEDNLNSHLLPSTSYLNQEESEAFGRLSVYYRGRIAPFDSYARDYCKAAFPKGSMPDDYTPVQLVTEIYLFPEKWPDQPKPAMKLFPQQSLWLAPEDDLSKADKGDTLFIAHILGWLRQSVIEGSHQQNIQIINSIATFQEKRCTAGSINRQKEKVEILYNQIKPERKIFLIEILLSLILLVLFITAYDSSWVKRCSLAFLLFSLVLITADIGVRCYLSGHNPFSGLFDTLMLVSAGMLMISLIISPKNKFIALPSLIASAFITLAATMMGGSSFSPLMPVLISPWLTIHVAIIMTAYCFLTFTFVLAIISIFLIIFQNKKYKKLKIKYLSQTFCILGAVFLAIGIMVGALWANISWGQYWSWDPKETWALITLLGYCIALPGVIPATEKHDWLYHLIVIVAFLLLLTTYFGVNFWMGGMHAYS